MPYNDMLANIAQDLIINDMLIQSRIGQFVEGGLHDPTIATYKDSWVDVYESCGSWQASRETSRARASFNN
jgi:hypothetical protein